MTLVNPDGLKRQNFYNHAVVKPGIPVFLTGQVAWDEDGNVVGAGDIAAQARQVWRNIDLLVRAAGGTRADIVKITTYATSRDFLPALHAARHEYFEGGDYPASTLIIVAGLAQAELLVEIDVTLMLRQR